MICCFFFRGVLFLVLNFTQITTTKRLKTLHLRHFAKDPPRQIASACNASSFFMVVNWLTQIKWLRQFFLLPYPCMVTVSSENTDFFYLILSSPSVHLNILQSKVLARRPSSRPMDAHFWKKHKENSPNLSYVYGKTWILDGQFSMSG